MLDELNKTRLNNVYSRCCLLPHAAVLLKCTYVATHIHKHTNTQTADAKSMAAIKLVQLFPAKRKKRNNMMRSSKFSLLQY